MKDEVSLIVRLLLEAEIPSPFTLYPLTFLFTIILNPES
jgi:hypothetical protein